ncbi:MAG TPA: polysaccharide biosynthesis/export family protein [Terriglobales bacterium]|nr:polysaccharide biosynthesis/export family protein [Terriglobales bacterium]
MRVVWKIIGLGAYVIAVMIALGVPGSGQTASLSQPPRPGSPDTKISALAGDPALRLGIGDLVDVSVYNVPELETKIRVSSDGNIDLPLINQVHVEGLTVEDAEAAIEQRLAHGGFVKNPHVQIFVQEYTSQGASVLGEVFKPGIYPVLGEEKLFSLISAAGGFTDRAGKNISVMHRGQPPVVVPISHNLEDHPDSNISVLAGDTVIVRRADVVYVVGDVGRPSGFLMDSGHISVLQAIALAGGTNSTAKLSGARIIRKGPAGLTSVPVPLKKLLHAKADDMPMEADDILFVPTSSRKQMEARSAEAAAQLATAVGVVAVHP